MVKTICGLIFAISALAEGPVFDAASIKPAPPPLGGMMRVGTSGGPGTSDPGLFKCMNCSISMLITQAYDIQRYQLTGPSSIDGDRFDINAKVPEGATKDQFRLMLQNLLADRFKLTVHHDKKEMAAFDLVVAKNGPRLKQAAPVDTDAAPADLPPPPPGGPQKFEIGKDGFPNLPKAPGHPITIMMPGRARNAGASVTMGDLAKTLTGFVGGKPVVDGTGLK
ncbi:MAG: TIGR03435 family protein, partial [Terriglobia bacterium]